MLRILQLTFCMALASVAMNGHAQDRVFMDFEWGQEYLSAPWFYASEEGQCGPYSVTPGTICSDKYRIFNYSTVRLSDAHDRTRYGAFESGVYQGNSGYALGVVYTAGVTVENGEVVEHGVPIFSIKQLEAALARHGDNAYAQVDLPGAPSIYYKNLSTFDNGLGVFENANRFSAYIWYPPSRDRYRQYSKKRGDGNIGPRKSVAWYPFIDDDKSSHYYHHMTNRPFGGWIKVEFDASPSHSNTGNFDAYHRLGEGGRDAPGNGVDYFTRIDAFALRFHAAEGQPSPYTVLTDSWSMRYQGDENEETITNLGLGHDPHQRSFDISLEDKFRCGDCTATYEVRYSFSPITNANFESAYAVSKVKNHYIEDDSASQYIIKPRAGYNQVWAKVEISQEHMGLFESGNRIYFAVKDLSDRSFMTLTSEELSAIAKVKTIYMDYVQPPPYEEVQYPESLVARHYGQSEYSAVQSQNLSAQPAKVSSDYTIRPSVNQVEKNLDIKFSPFDAGVYDLRISTPSIGKKRLVSVNTKVTVQMESCTIDVACSYQVLADFKGAETKLGYSEFDQGFKNNATLATKGLKLLNEEANVAIYGSGVTVSSPDMLTLRFHNESDLPVSFRPKITQKHNESYVSTRGDGWVVLPIVDILPKASTTVRVPASLLANQEKLSMINVSWDASDVSFSSIGLYRDTPLRCDKCGDVLVNFFADGEGTVTPFVGWSDAFMDIYTGKVDEGAGVVIGGNGSYNYQGVKSRFTNLPYGYRNVKFVWGNKSAIDITLTPMYSFNDPDRRNAGALGDWESIGEITIPAGGEVSQSMRVPYGISMINTTMNRNNRGLLFLNRIEIFK